MGLWRRYLDRRRRPVAVLAPSTDGFCLSHGPAGRAVAWAEVRRITAFKRDLLTTDCICLVLMLTDGIIEVNEEMEGFTAFRAGMERHFGLSPLWLIEIMPPAFATSPRYLYHHPDLIEQAR